MNRDEKRINLMHVKQWREAMALLKDFKYDKQYNYTVTYKQGTQTKERSFSFHEVKYIEETKSFNFLRYLDDFNGHIDWNSDPEILTLYDTDILNVNKSETIDLMSYPPMVSRIDF
jgi:hypothetical protein